MHLVDYHTHPLAHGEDFVKPAHRFELLQKFVRKAEERGLEAIGFSDHDRFLTQFNWKNLKRIKAESRLNISLGVEFDYRPEKEGLISRQISRLPLDYTIGSVHTINGWEVDHPDYIDEYGRRDISEVYQQYFSLVRQAVNSGLFKIIGHLDLVKVFGFRPEPLDWRTMTSPVLKAVKKAEMIIEVNTNGFNKPAAEQYPARVILEEAYQLSIPVTFGSDAHRAGRVGEGIGKAAEMVKKIGYNEVAAFRQGSMVLWPL